MPDEGSVSAEITALREELAKIRALQEEDRAVLDRLIQRYAAQDIAVERLIDIGRRLGRAERDGELGSVPARGQERGRYPALRAVTGLRAADAIARPAARSWRR